MEPIMRMPREIIYKILQNSPDIAVLQREIPHQHYTQALCHFAVLEGSYSLPTLASFEAYRPYIASFMRNIRSQCDRAQGLAISLKSARLISRTEKKVARICEVLMEDDFFPERQALFPLGNVIQFLRPTQEERTRAHQGIYLFNLLACLCRNLDVDGRDNAADLEDFREELQQSIIEHLMAPWEFYHAIGIRIYLCRALYRSTRIPSIIVTGVDALHHILCAVGPSEPGRARRPGVVTARDSCSFAFRSMPSKALSTSWSHKWNEICQTSLPLWRESGADISGWRRFENRQFETLGRNPRLSDVIKHDTILLDGSFGLWGATLWDESRWDDIVELTAETRTDAYLDPMALGILLVEEKAWVHRNVF